MLSTLKRLRYYHFAGIAAGLSVVATFLIAPKLTERMQQWLVAIWFIVPPLFFFWEHYYVRKNYPDDYESMHDSQEAARHIWAGIAAALALLYLKESR